jgi:hypothetical protein
MVRLVGHGYATETVRLSPEATSFVFGLTARFSRPDGGRAG